MRINTDDYYKTYFKSLINQGRSDIDLMYQIMWALQSPIYKRGAMCAAEKVFLKDCAIALNYGGRDAFMRVAKIKDEEE